MAKSYLHDDQKTKTQKSWPKKDPESDPKNPNYCLCGGDGAFPFKKISRKLRSNPVASQSYLLLPQKLLPPHTNVESQRTTPVASPSMCAPMWRVITFFDCHPQSPSCAQTTLARQSTALSCGEAIAGRYKYFVVGAKGGGISAGENVWDAVLNIVVFKMRRFPSRW